VSGLDWRLGGTAGIRPGPTNSIVDVPGIRVGHATRAGDGWLSGVTVIVAEHGARGGVDVRGGGAATRETAALEPTGVVDQVHAVSFSGGSAYGLESATGVLRGLQARGLGFRVGRQPREVVPVVPGAAIYDLGRGGDFDAWPGPELGLAALEAAFMADRGAGVVQGGIGAGTGAITGEMKGGIGSASAVLPGGVVVAALVVVNAAGATLDPRTGVPWGAFAELPLIGGAGEFGVRTPTAAEHAAAVARLTAEAGRRPALRPLNTTLAVVATDAALGKAELTRLASASHDGMARAIRPVHTLGDGDVVFALSTGGLSASGELFTPGDLLTPGGLFAPGARLPPPADGLLAEHRHSDSVNQVLTAGADALTRAIVHAVLAAHSVTTPAGVVPSYRDLYDSPR
jgi:putative pantetheine hydrolase